MTAIVGHVPCPLDGELDPIGAFAKMLSRRLELSKELSLTADRLDTGANWRVLVLSPAHHRSRLSDSVKNGNALRTMHNAALPAR